MLRRSLPLALVALLAMACADSSTSESTADPVIDGEVAVDVGENGHTTEPVTYSVDPPAGGQHHPSWLACGVYDEPVPTERAVHSLEHGAAWITHGELGEEDLASLATVAGSSTRVLVSPYPALDAGDVVVSTWGWQLRLDGVDDPRLADFLDAHVDGDDAPEPGAPCS